MELYIEDTHKLQEIENHFKNDNAAISVTSIDGIDNGQMFLIKKDDLCSLGMDEDGNIIWWKEYSPLEGKYFTRSAAFEKYKLV